MKNLILSFLLLLFLFSCNRNEEDILNGYYYDVSSSVIYSFNNSNLIKFNFLDSILKEKKYVRKNNLIKTKDGDITFKIKNDTLLLHNTKNKGKKVTLKKINYSNINKKEIDSTNWSMVVSQISRENNTKYKEEQLIRVFNNRIDAYYIKSNDTIFGQDFESRGKMFNKFYTFKKEYITIVFVNKTANELQMVLCYGDDAKLYTLKKMKFNKLL